MQDSFWNGVFPALDARAMADKYAFLRRAVLEAGGPAAPSALREAARRWPGSLRECQRVEPGRYRAREGWARRGASSPERARAAWLADGQAAICLWSELHRLTGEVLAWRLRLRGSSMGADGEWSRAGGSLSRPNVDAGPDEFLRDLTLRDPERRAAWPEAAVLEALPRSSPAAPGGGVSPTVAEAWLALRIGWDRATLRACLLGLDEP